MKYLVLGSAGQIGAPLCKWLRRFGEVIEFDIERDPREDLRIYESAYLNECVAACDFVFFLAFDVGGSRYLKIYQETFEFLSNNMRLMEFSFEAIRKHKKPFLFVSSQMSEMSYSSYGTLKALGEYYAKSLGGLVVRCWNVYGIERDLAKSHAITDFVLKARDKHLIDMITDGQEERQMLYVDDCCKCMHLLSQKYHEIPRNKPLHISCFEWSKIVDIAEMIAKHFPGTEVVPAHSVDDVQRNLRNEPDPFILNYWRPETPLAEGVRRIAEYYSTHY